jgi:purine catabolism regulator
MWRGFTVGDVVAALATSGAEVVAGAGGLANHVRHARLVPSTARFAAAGPGDLLVASVAALPADGQASAGLVDRLATAEVAGLALRLDGADGLPAEARDAADRAALPLILFPEASALADVASAVLDALLEAQRRRLERVLDIHQRFNRVTLAGGGEAEVAAELHAVLGCPVAVVDAAGRATVTVPPGASALDAGADAGAVVRQPIHAGGESYGEIIAFAEAAGLDDDQLVAIERASLAIAMRLAQASAVAEAEARFAAVSLEELVAGHPGAADAVAGRAASFGWDLRRPRAVLLASVDPPVESHVLRNALATIAAAARATLGPDAIVWARSEMIAALLAPESDAPGERRAIAERLRRELDARLQTVTVSIGIGRRAELAGLPRSFAEANRAVEVGRWAKGRHVTAVFDELGLERLLASAPPEELADFVQHAIGPLVLHDRLHRSGLVDTLEMWLRTRNMAESARRIHVHYNTFKNRLERIESILGPVVDDAARSLECEVALHVLRHYEGPWLDEPGGAEDRGELG